MKNNRKMFLLFVFVSILGTYYEQILNLITCFLDSGDIVWEYRRGVIIGPFSPIYGAGAVLFVYLLNNKNLSNLKIILYGGLIGGSFEYIISFLQETFVGTTSWNYSNHLLNINGRTTIPFMFFWGLASFILVKVIYPNFSKLIDKIPLNISTKIYYILLVFLTFDMVFSFSALIRQNLRRNNFPSLGPIGDFYDTYYPDDVLKKYYPNMVIK